jgi:hypothetical protein
MRAFTYLLLYFCTRCSLPTGYGVDIEKLPDGGYKGQLQQEIFPTAHEPLFLHLMRALRHSFVSGCEVPPFQCLVCHRGLKPECVLCGQPGRHNAQTSNLNAAARRAL